MSDESAFEAGYVNGLAVRRSQNEHGRSEAFRAGMVAGRSMYEADIDYCSQRVELAAGRALGLAHADHGPMPAELNSDEAVVWLAVATHPAVDRSALHAYVCEAKPHLSIGQVDTLRKALDQRGLVSSARDGHRTVYSVLTP